MIRMQIQLDRATREALRRRAFEEGKSTSAVAREILERALGPRSGDGVVREGDEVPPGVRKLFPFVGMIRDDPENVSENHDDYLFGDDEP